MCEQCYTDLGRPDNWNPNVARALELIRTIYATEPTGGPLHVVLDDWNIDGDIRTQYNPYPDCDPEADDAATELVLLFDELSLAERASALARHRGFLPTATEA